MRPIIIHHLNALTLGGTERMVQIMMKHFVKDGEFNHILAHQAWQDQTRKKYFTDIMTEDKIITYGSFPEFHEILKKVKPFVVHHYASGIPEYPLIPQNKPYVNHFVQTAVFSNQNNVTDISKVIYVSNYNKHIANTFDDNKYHVVHNALQYPPTEADLREELGISKDTWVFGRIGRPDPNTYDNLNIRAYAEVEKIYGDKVCFISLPNTDLVQKDVRELGIKNYYGLDLTTDEDRIYRFYNTLNVQLHSRKDGECCSFALLDGMMCGVPVITSYSAIFNGQIETTGTGGFVVMPEDLDEYVNIIKKIVDKNINYDYISKKAKEHAMQWSEDKMAKLQLDIYKELS